MELSQVVLLILEIGLWTYVIRKWAEYDGNPENDQDDQEGSGPDKR